jgi:hypothetical protein
MIASELVKELRDLKNRIYHVSFMNGEKGTKTDMTS